MRSGLLTILLVLAPLTAHAEAMLAAVDTARDRVRGVRTAENSLVVYVDFVCPFCRVFHETVEATRVNYPHIRIVYRNFPLPFHKEAMTAARAAECVAEIQGDEGYWRFVDAIFDLDAVNASSLRTLALELGADGSGFDACLASSTVAEKIAWDKESGLLAGVSGTPTSFLIKADGVAIKIKGALAAKMLSTHFDKATRKGVDGTKITTTKRTPRVRPAVTGERRWK